MNLKLQGFFCTILILLSFVCASCNSTDNQKWTETDSICYMYNDYYNDLKKIADNINSRSGESFERSVDDQLTSIDIMLSSLNKYNCPTKKDLTFIDTAIAQLHIEKKRRQKEAEITESTGDDFGMNGVQTSAVEILFDENMNSYVNVKVFNHTKRGLRSLKFGIKYCKAEHHNSLCYKFVIIPTKIEPMSSKDLSFNLPKHYEGQTDYPEIQLLEIVRSDGTKMPTEAGIIF